MDRNQLLNLKASTKRVLKTCFKKNTVSIKNRYKPANQKLGIKGIFMAGMKVFAILLIVNAAVVPLLFFSTQKTAAVTSPVYPNADITRGWPLQTGCTATTHYDCLDETVNNTADFVNTGTSGTTGETEEYDMTSVAGASAPVSQVSVTVYSHSVSCLGNGTNCDDLDISISIDGVYQTTQTCTGSASNSACTKVYTGTWTGDDDLKVRVVRIRVGGGNATSADDNVRLTSIKADITYVNPELRQSAYRWFGSPSSENWTKRRKITFNNSASTENLIDFPVRVSLDSSNIDYSFTQDAGQDLRFVDPNGAILSHEIETWDEAGTSEVWVKVPRIDVGSTTDYIWMYYGNSTAPDRQNPTKVWSNGYISVWHLKQASGSNRLDSTVNSNSLTPNNTVTAATGKIGTGISIDNVPTNNSQFLSIGDAAQNGLDISGNFTIEAWVNSATSAATQGIVTKNESGNAGYQMRINSTGDRGQLLVSSNGSGGVNITGSTAISTNTWTHMVGTYNGAQLDLYLNGSSNKAPTALTGSINTNAGALIVGGNVGNTDPFDGQIDEVRISNVARSAEWVEATYITQNNAMNSFGGEETGGYDVLDTWTARRKITFNSSSVGTALTDFPVRVSLSASNIDYTNTQDAGQDIRFIDTDGTSLSHEIEVWNEAGTSEVWVKVQQIDANSTTDYIWMYYGNTGAGDGQDPSGVWTNGYKGVWHMNNDPSGTAPQLRDSTANGNHATAAGSMTSSQLITTSIGKGIDFDGSDDRFTLADNDSLDIPQGYITTYVKREATGSLHSIIGKSDTSSDGSQNYVLKISNTDKVYGAFGEGSFGNLIAGSTNITNTSIYYAIGFRWNASRTLYVDGSQDGNGSNTRTPTPNSGALNIGQVGGDVERFNGVIDELRLSSIDRSADWAIAEHMTFANTLNSYGAEENSTYNIEASASLGQALAASDASAELQYPSVPFRLRLAVHSVYSMANAGQSFKLQVSLRSGTCDIGWIGEDYVDMSQATNDIRFYDDPTIPNGTSIVATAEDPVHTGHTNVAQTFVENNPFDNGVAVPDGSDAMWDFAFQDVTANFDSGYCFRMVKSDNSLFDYYDVIPEISICKPPTAALMRGGKYFCQGTKRGFIW